MPRFRPVSVHVSDMRAFDMCRRRWWFSSVNALNLQPSIPIPALWLGTGIHLGLDAFYQRKDAVAAYDAWLAVQMEALRREHAVLWPEELVSLEGQGDLGRTMLRHYKLWARGHDDFEVLSTERLFSLPVTKPGNQRALAKVRFEGRIDGLVRDTYGRIWVLEHKSAKRFPSERSLEYNDQATGYALAANAIFGVMPAGVIFNYLIKALPAPPHVLQNGQLSTNRQQRISPELFYAALLARGLDPKEPRYADFLGYLLSSPHRFFRRYRVYRTNSELTEFQERMYWTAREMRRADVPIWASNQWYACALGCPFEGPCRAMSSGGNWQMLLDAQYCERPRSGILLEEENEDVVATEPQ